MGFKRDLFTDELVETPSVNGGRQIIYREPVYYTPSNGVNPWAKGKDHVDKGMSLQPEQATPERIAAENEAARHHGTGAYYTPDGICHTPTRGSLAREMRRNNRQMNNPGYGDCAGR